MTGSQVDWKNLAATSHYQTAVAVDDALKRGDTVEASVGIEELIDALSRAERRALRSQLIRLMAHIVKWKSQPEKRSRSWRGTIKSARREIADIQEETPSLSRDVIQAMWNDCFELACMQAEGEMDREPEVTKLSWKEVFDKEYELPQ